MTWHATFSERRWAAVVLALAAVAGSGCGRKGDPLPPVVRLAARTTDLSVVQREQTAVLQWGFPSMTSVGGPLPDLESVEVWRAVLPAAQEPRGESRRARDDRVRLLAARGELRRTLDVAGLDEATRGSSLVVVEDLTDLAPEGGEVVWYAVRSRCCGDRPSEFSNIARLVPGSPPTAPSDLAGEASREGIRLSWSSADELPVEVERSRDGVVWRAVTAEPVAAAEWLDVGADQGATWRYRLRSVVQPADGVPVVGPPSLEIEVPHPDRYPPEPPNDLVCLPEAARVLMRWRPGLDAVLYRVERSTDREPATVIGAGITDLMFADMAPPPGAVTYVVRSLDAAGNLSAPSTCTATMGGVPQ